jgi:sugar/nucleoside kinase (ribokinase family)
MTETLIVGGLTVDRFIDGSTAPGGSVLHSGLAAVEDGARLTLLTVAGDEPAARDGLDRLRTLGRLVHQAAASSTVYRHEERDGARVLVLEARSGAIAADDVVGVPRPDVALIAPIADEIAPAAVERLRRQLVPRWTVLLIQGWLRHLAIGEEVRPLPLAELSAETVAMIGAADAIVVSTEDLVESPDDPFAQAAALRSLVGPRPILVLTLGAEGYLLDDPAADRLVASVPKRVVTGVRAVGAGDTFGAALALGLARGATAHAAAESGCDRVIALLESRRAPRR